MDLNEQLEVERRINRYLLDIVSKIAQESDEFWKPQIKRGYIIGGNGETETRISYRGEIIMYLNIDNRQTSFTHKHGCYTMCDRYVDTMDPRLIDEETAKRFELDLSNHDSVVEMIRTRVNYAQGLK